MKKSTVLLIFVIYIASIVAIGFFGMRAKVFNEIKYIKSIEISVQMESSEMYTLKLLPEKDEITGNPQYNLILDYSQYAVDGEFFNEETQTNITRKYLLLNFIPKITYKDGSEWASDEGINYSISRQDYIEDKSVELQENGTMICYKSKISFYVYVMPNTKGDNGSGANIHVFVR